MVKRIHNLLKISLVCCSIVIFVLTGCFSKSEDDDSNLSSLLTNDVFKINQPKDITVLSVDWSIDDSYNQSVKLVYESNNERYFLVLYLDSEISLLNLIVPNDKVRLTLKESNGRIFKNNDWDIEILNEKERLINGYKFNE